MSFTVSGGGGANIVIQEGKEIEITGATENCTVEKTEADGKTQFAISVNIPEPEKCECKEVEVVSANEEAVTVTKTETDEKTTFAVDVNLPTGAGCECKEYTGGYAIDITNQNVVNYTGVAVQELPFSGYVAETAEGDYYVKIADLLDDDGNLADSLPYDTPATMQVIYTDGQEFFVTAHNSLDKCIVYGQEYIKSKNHARGYFETRDAFVYGVGEGGRLCIYMNCKCMNPDFIMGTKPLVIRTFSRYLKLVDQGFNTSLGGWQPTINDLNVIQHFAYSDVGRYGLYKLTTEFNAYIKDDIYIDYNGTQEKLQDLLGNSGGANGDTYGVSVDKTIKCTTTSENGHTDFKIEIDRIQPSTLIDYYGTTYTMGDVISALRNIGQLH